MKTFVLAFFLMFQLAPAMDKEQIISGFIDVMKKDVVIHYIADIKFEMENRVILISNDCFEKFIMMDTLARGYFNFKSELTQFISVYCGVEYYTYVYDSNKDSIVSTFNREKNPDDFIETIKVEHGVFGFGHQINTIIQDVVNRYSNYKMSFLKLLKYFENKENIEQSIVLPDSIINEADCYKIKINDKDIIAFDKKTFIPVYYFFDDMGITYEAYYSNQQFINIESDEIFSRKAFPPNCTFKYFVSESKNNYLYNDKPAPDWDLTGIDGKDIELDDLKGKTTLIMFSKLDCKSCLSLASDLNEIALDNNDINIVAIYPYDSQESLQNFSYEKKIKYYILFDAIDVANEYFIHFYPTIYILDKEGIPRHQISGYNPRFKNILNKVISKFKEN